MNSSFLRTSLKLSGQHGFEITVLYLNVKRTCFQRKGCISLKLFFTCSYIVLFVQRYLKVTESKLGAPGPHALAPFFGAFKGYGPLGLRDHGTSDGSPSPPSAGCVVVSLMLSFPASHIYLCTPCSPEVFEESVLLGLHLHDLRLQFVQQGGL